MSLAPLPSELSSLHHGFGTLHLRHVLEHKSAGKTDFAFFMNVKCKIGFERIFLKGEDAEEGNTTKRMDE